MRTEVAQVQQQRLPRAAVDDRQLVEQPARHAHVDALRPLADARELERLELVGAGGERDRDLERRRGGEAGARRQRRGQVRVQPPQRASHVAQRTHDGADVAIPAGSHRDGCACRPRGTTSVLVQRQRVLAFVQRRAHHDLVPTEPTLQPQR